MGLFVWGYQEHSCPWIQGHRYLCITVKMQRLIHKVCGKAQKFTFLIHCWEMLRFLVYSPLLNSKGQCIAGSESAGSESIYIFNFFRKCQTVFKVVPCIPIVYHSCQHWLSDFSLSSS